MNITRSLGQSIMWLFVMLYSITSLASGFNGTDKASGSNHTNKGTRYNDVGKKIDDTVIISQIKLKFTKDQLLNPIDIEVTSDDGYVSLKGEVESNTEYSQAVMLADSVDGVRDVDATDLKVADSRQPLTDTAITAKVKGKIIKEKLFGDKDVKYWTVKVETKNGTVFLSGTVDNNQQKKNLITIAQSVVEDKEAVNVDALKVKG